MLDESIMKEIKRKALENTYPYFTDEDIEAYYMDNLKDVNKTVYQLLQLKAEDTTLSVSGLNCGDTSKYFRRISQKYRPNNSGILQGG